MPIRFRCAYCNQLMGIARRKAGTVVRCPTCSGQVVVPTPPNGEEDDKAPAAADADLPDLNAPSPPAKMGGSPLFEQSDIEQDMFAPAAVREPPPKPAAAAAAPPPPPKPFGGYDASIASLPPAPAPLPVPPP